MKKILSIILCLSCVLMFSVPAFGLTTAESLITYDLSSGGKHDITVATNDEITVAYTMIISEDSPTSTTQNQIVYDHEFFELVEGSVGVEEDFVEAFTTSTPVETDGTHYIYYNSTANINFPREESFVIGTFKLKVLAKSGSSLVRNTEYKSTDSSADLYASAKQDLKVTIGGGDGPTPPTPDEPVEIDVPTPAASLVYTGLQQTGVADGTGYTVEKGTATEAGKYEATVKLADGYKWKDGSKEDKKIEWSIEAATIDTATATSQVYTGSVLSPVLTVKAGTLDATYDIGGWDGNLKDIGTYTATVTGKGNFKGTKTVTFVITPKGVLDVPTPTANLVYTGLEQTGVADGTNYTVENGTATEAGNYKATVKLADGYAWSDGTTADKQINWSIGAATIDTATAASQEFTGSILTPVLTVKAGALDATYDIGDWSGELKKPGTYTATVTGKGNFKGTKTVTFEITHDAHNPQLQQGKNPEEFTPGFKPYYECACGALFEDEECTKPIDDLDAWKAKGGNGYIAALDGDDDSNGNGKGTKTGDSSEVILWLSLMLMSAGGYTGYRLIRKRETN